MLTTAEQRANHRWNPRKVAFNRRRALWNYVFRRKNGLAQPGQILEFPITSK